MKLTVLPVQLLEKAVTVICETIGTLKLPVAIIPLIFPIPLAAIPEAVLSLVHLYSVPLTLEPLNIMGEIVWLPHTVMSATGLTEGFGETDISNIAGTPLHPFVKGVTVTILLTGTFEIFCVVKDGIFPVPEMGLNPIILLVWLQL